MNDLNNLNNLNNLKKSKDQKDQLLQSHIQELEHIEYINKIKLENSELKKQSSSSDWWGTHNVSTRLGMLIFFASYLGIVIATVFGIAIPSTIIDMVWYTAILSFLIIALGINGVEKILNGINRFKYGKN